MLWNGTPLGIKNHSQYEIQKEINNDSIKIVKFFKCNSKYLYTKIGEIRLGKFRSYADIVCLSYQMVLFMRVCEWRCSNKFARFHYRLFRFVYRSFIIIFRKFLNLYLKVFSNSNIRSSHEGFRRNRSFQTIFRKSRKQIGNFLVPKYAYAVPSVSE